MGDKKATLLRWVPDYWRGTLRMQHFIDGKWEYVDICWVDEKTESQWDADIDEKREELK